MRRSKGRKVSVISVVGLWTGLRCKNFWHEVEGPWEDDGKHLESYRAFRVAS